MSALPSPPTALVLRHDPTIGLGNVAGTLAEHGYVVTTIDAPGTDVDALDPLGWDVVVVLGGTEGAYETQHPYLAAEQRLLAARTAARAPILAICLGAQMMAQVLGARAYRGEVHEVGFVEVDLTPAGVTSPVRHVAGAAMVEWHHDTFDVPAGVEVLASSEHYVQAYSSGTWLLAVQFHPEVDEEIFTGWVSRWSQELRTGQRPEDLLAEMTLRLDAAQAASRAMVGEWLDGLRVG